MKKLVAISVLLVFLTAAAFAQFTVGIVADFYPNLLKTTAPTGDNADVNNQAYDGKGTFDFFSSSDTFKASELRINFKYVAPEEKYGGELAINADQAVRRGAAFFANADDPNIPPTNLQGLLDATFGDWNVWGKVGVLKGFVGNTADRGAAGDLRYNDAFSIFFDDVQMSFYGIIAPNGLIDTFNLGKYARTDDNEISPITGLPINTLYADNGKPYVSITADLAPVKVAVAGDLSRVAFDDTNWDSYNKVGAAVRVSADKIADLISFDAIYKIHGGDEQIDDNLLTGGTPQPDNRGIWAHNFGLVANLSLLDSLGIGIGYSGYAIAEEKGRGNSGDSDRKTVYPYFNGIDLRFEFTGVDKLIVDFDNNISFSTIRGSGDSNTTDMFPFAVGNLGFGVADMDPEISAGYLGLYNALGVKYQVTEELFANFGIQNGLMSYTLENKDTDAKGVVTVNNFRALLGAGYAFGSHVQLETGLLFNVESLTSEITDTDNFSGGEFTFAIPIRFKVALP
jgi:hypothetical protein